MKSAAALALAVALALGATSAGSARPDRVRISVTPVSTLADEPVHIRIAGLGPRKLATVGVRATDANGKRWHSSAIFRANARGVIEIDRGKAISGSYRGVWGMGLIATMTTKAPLAGYAFAWGSQSTRFRVVVGARGTAFQRAHRIRPLRDELHTVEGSGFYGRYFADETGRPGPAVLLLGGSEGGLSGSPIAELLAQHGFPTLALGYFHAPGLPETLANIPLEYFAGALRWLREQPEVDSTHVTVIGVSRGSEAAQLLGVHYPELVQAVVPSVPSNVALCAFPPTPGSSWTFEGRLVPCTTQFNDPAPSDDPAAVIPDERIRGPVFLVCGGLDSIWLSCPYARTIMARLEDFHHPYADSLHAFARAGHFVGGLVPYQLAAPPLLTVPADERGREDVWPKLLSFLSLRDARGRGGR
ncbi:MAG: acyl-CoA thioesterase/BAAT N-terminal domain-containing protein [Actinobacteria bacterium]|nr:acyl-CoA thioesterase/BAAT N-terminal domain-containing protein [Actinomycetota bacterium]